jgi:signal recognition particle subunit SRP19
MRKQDKTIIWPVYFDSSKTRGDGRRVPKGLSVPSPKILEIKDAVEKLGMECELVMEAAYPKMPWLKTGVVLVKKKEAKEQTIKKIARQLAKVRSATVTK